MISKYDQIIKKIQNSSPVPTVEVFEPAPNVSPVPRPPVPNAGVVVAPNVGAADDAPNAGVAVVPLQANDNILILLFRQR